MRKRTQSIHPALNSALKVVGVNNTTNWNLSENDFKVVKEADSNSDLYYHPNVKLIPHPKLVNVFPLGFYPQPSKSFRKNCEDKLINVRYRDNEYWLNTKYVYKNNELKTLLLKENLVEVPVIFRTTTSFSYPNSQFNYAPSSREECNQQPIKDFRWVNFEDWSLFALVYAPHSEYPIPPANLEN